MAEVTLLVSFCLRVLAPEESLGSACFEDSIVPVPLRQIPSLTLTLRPSSLGHEMIAKLRE